MERKEGRGTALRQTNPAHDPTVAAISKEILAGQIATSESLALTTRLCKSVVAIRIRIGSTPSSASKTKSWFKVDLLLRVFPCGRAARHMVTCLNTRLFFRAQH